MAHNAYKEMRFKHDECYTTNSEAEKIVKYISENNIIEKDKIIWLPFDNTFSNIYKQLVENGYNNLVLSNLEMGLDFYLYEPEDWDIIITNPPFSGRTNLMKRLLSFNKPFIILQGTQFFNNQYAVNCLCAHEKDFKFLFPQSRMSFLTFNAKENIIKSGKSGISFYSFWLCYKVKLNNIFTTLADTGKENNLEQYDVYGNVIVDNHLNLFTLPPDE